MATTIELTARNWATSSDNKIHDDEVAATFGFRGGLVPGVTLYGYLAECILRDRGAGWLTGGTCSVRFGSPVYDGEPVSAVLDEDGSLTLIDLDGVACTTGTTDVPAQPRPVVADLPSEGLPLSRPPADEASLAPGTVLGSIVSHPTRAVVEAYLDAIGLVDEVCGPLGLVHPAWLLLDANDVLVANVRMGPWIHAGSTVTSYEPVALGTPLDVHASVTDHFERNGHRFTVLDVVSVADGMVVQRVEHTAIYRLRGSA